MNFIIADTFSRSLARLDTQSQSLVKQQAFDFQMDPARPGFKFHRLDGKDKNFWSFRVNDDIRIIVHQTPDSFVLCYTDHHDAAYRWAERRKLSVHPDTGAAQLVEVVERTEEIVKRVYKHVGPAIFARFEDSYLSALGVPAEWLDAVKHVTEDDFDSLFEHLPEEAVERLMELALGNPVRVPDRQVADTPFLHPDAQRRFRILGGQRELQQALEYPWDQWIVFLHPTQRRAVERTLSGPGRVSGPAGTGKSVVGLHRAARLAGRIDARVLLTTYSRTLAARLSQSADILMGEDAPARARVQVEHLHRVAVRLRAARGGGSFKAASRRQLVEILDSANRRVGGGMFPTAFVRAEWDALIDPHWLPDWDSYRAISRAGRGTPLGARQRQRVWKICDLARTLLSERRLMTWSQLCHETAERLTASDQRPFDHVVADEAQDFGPAEMRLVRALAKEAPDDLFFCGDMGQRIYKRRFAWRAMGIDIRGRSTRLEVNYRTTEEIRRFADRMLPGSIVDGDGDDEPRRGVSLLNGPVPEIRGFGDDTAEVEGVAGHLEQWLQSGVNAGEVAIFARSESILHKRGRAVLDLCGLAGQELSDDAPIEPGRVSLGTMHRAKGLEFKAVVVMGTSVDRVPLPTALEECADPSDREAVIEQERQLLYVACTRAREHLLVTYTGEPCPFLPVSDAARTE